MRSGEDSFKHLALLSDAPISQASDDGLGLCNWADVVAAGALGTPGPFTIGIFGGWGVGKTSILQLAKQRIDSSAAVRAGRITTVMFNAWRYEREEQPLIPLLAVIERQLRLNQQEHGQSSGRGLEVQKALRALLHGISAGFSAQLPALGSVKLDLAPDKAIESFEELRATWLEHQIENSVFLKAFEALQQTQASGGSAGSQAEGSEHRIVVFIDDLVRCFPNRAVRLLENIKLVLSEPGFIFVLAVDRRVLESYLDKRYRKKFGLADYHQGQSYLAKFVQLPLWIPPHKPQRFKDLIEKLLARQETEGLRAVLSSSLAGDIGLACEHNPRQLVRFLNDLLVDQRLLELEPSFGETFPFELFMVARGLRMQSERIYRALLEDREWCQRLAASEDHRSLKGQLKVLIEETEEEATKQAVLLEILAKESLARLLLSGSGKKWLTDERRHRIESFFVRERPTDDAEDDESFIRKLVLEAIEQLRSQDESEILAGSLLLRAYAQHELATEAIPQLRKLMQSQSPQIREQAERALEALTTDKN